MDSIINNMIHLHIFDKMKNFVLLCIMCGLIIVSGCDEKSIKAKYDRENQSDKRHLHNNKN